MLCGRQKVHLLAFGIVCNIDIGIDIDIDSVLIFEVYKGQKFIFLWLEK